LLYLSSIETPIGEMVAGATEEGVCLLEFADRGRLKKEYKEIETLLNAALQEGENEHIETLRLQLDEYFEGTLKAFTVNLVVPGTSFQQAVWKELLKIPYGETRSYLEQSEAAGKPGAIRAVASANGRNRISILIPCHRVIGADGNLKGYGGGLWRKKWLLEHEKKHSRRSYELSLFR
jgi:AraC family transcriptional regulator, regulatory protein of adaptative response / methylated-DNA-[protein]-cysteine methyltransferase